MQTQMFGNMIVERRLRNTSRSLRTLSEELRILTEQLEHFADDAHDKEIRSLVSETPLAAREFEDAERHRHAIESHVMRLRHQIVELEKLQDNLLDRMSGRD
jgi:CII-binding regulator of phage lambda lysogenization HflD